MPTAGRLAGAITYGALALYLSELLRPVFEEEGLTLTFTLSNGVIGVLVGWIIAGSRAGRGYPAAIGYGITAGVALVFWFAFVWSFLEMIERSLDKRYKGALEAVTDIFNLGMESVVEGATPVTIGTLVVGALMAALVTDFIGQRLP
ncbi:MAG: TrgA family protein [Marivivens sp.]|nr:TrgA family protein [Marivivens sp.]